jgi:hypothetical protein
LAFAAISSLSACAEDAPRLAFPAPGWGGDAPLARDTDAPRDTDAADDTAADADTDTDGGDTSSDTDDGTSEETGEESDVRVVVAPDYTNLRVSGSGSAEVIRAIHCGTRVTVTGEADGRWLPVSAEGEEGWIKDTYLAPSDQVVGDICPGPDAYLGDTPGRVEDVLATTPYVEQSCSSTTWDGWPFDAKRCTYNGGLRVTVANPSAEQVTAWIADASQMIPALWSLQERDRDAWKDGLEIIASHTMYQSSRIFPLEGEVDEGYVYDFDRGVTEGCTTGCYCRINSLTRSQYCDYAANVLGTVDEGDCLDEYSTDTFTDEWAEHCLDNHRAAWTGVHHHYRAMAYWANKTMEDYFPDPERADPDEVIDVLNSLY